MKHINGKVEQFKHEDGNLYAIYATPAENLCGLQVKQFRKKYGIVENVSDREYVSNGFHCHVTEDITPIQKQNLEHRFWEMCIRDRWCTRRDASTRREDRHFLPQRRNSCAVSVSDPRNSFRR